MIWSNSASDDQLFESNEDDTDRLFTFEVAKTKEQKEGVAVRQGFEACYFFHLLSDYQFTRLISAPPMNSLPPNYTQNVPRTASSSNHACYLAKRDRDL